MVSSSSSVDWSGPSLSFSFSFVSLLFILFFHFSILKKKEKQQIWKHPPTPLQWVLLVFPARFASFPTRRTPKRSHQRKHLDCLHGFDLTMAISFEWAFIINYYKSISRFIRKRAFSRAKSFPYDFRWILSLASSGFPLNWGVKKHEWNHLFFCNKMGLCTRWKIISFEEPQAKTDKKMNLYCDFLFLA